MRAEPELFPAVRFEPGFRARVERALARCARARAGFESTGRAWTAGGGDDVAGSRAYRPGDDPRTIDWNASARSERVIVRVLRRARGGHDVVALDASLSMAVGPPGKLQRSAEVAAALALLAARGGAVVTVLALPQRARFDLQVPAAFPALCTWLETLRAEGAIEWPAAPLPRCERATWIGDLAGASPPDLARLAPRGAGFRVLQMLAPHERAPFASGPVAWWEPEHGAQLELDVDAAAVAAHARALERLHDARHHELARRGARIARASSDEPFEVALARILRA